MSYVEKLESIGKNIEINNIGIKITEDALLLSYYIKNIFKEKGKLEKNFLEIGAGQGIISIILSEILLKHKNSKIYALEIQNNIFQILKKNIYKNNLQNEVIPIYDDVKKISDKENYDYIFSNPPYRKINGGQLPKIEEEKNSKYEFLLTLEELFLQIKRLLKNYGEFFIIVPNDRLNDCFNYIYKNNLNIINLEINEYRKRKLIIVHGKKGGKNNSEINIEYKKRI